jgi:hypothetical protein
VQARAQQITDVVLRDEDRMRHLQHEMEKIAAHKEQAETELHAVSTKGHTDGLIAGVPMSRIEHNQSKSRYELKARPVTSGLSHDTLAQTPGMSHICPFFLSLSKKTCIRHSLSATSQQPTASTHQLKAANGARSTKLHRAQFWISEATRAHRRMSTRKVCRRQSLPFSPTVVVA